ncbi:MAG: hypothetical protein ABI367_14710 [Mucilaginibacter sp.]
MENYKNKLSNLAGKLKQEKPQTPIQQVQPVKTAPPKEAEAQFNIWLPKSLLKDIKNYGVANDISQKDIGIDALKRYLKTHQKPLTTD